MGIKTWLSFRTPIESGQALIRRLPQAGIRNHAPVIPATLDLCLVPVHGNDGWYCHPGLRAGMIINKNPRFTRANYSDLKLIFRSCLETIS